MPTTSKYTFSSMNNHSGSSILSHHPHPQLHSHTHAHPHTHTAFNNALTTSLSLTHTTSKPTSMTSTSQPIVIKPQDPTTATSTIPTQQLDREKNNISAQDVNHVTNVQLSKDRSREGSTSPAVAVVVAGNNSKNPSSWDPEDDLLLRHLKEIKKFGWKEISQYFNNRTPNACQFRWRRLKSGNLKSNKTAMVDVTDYSSVIKALNEGKLNEYKTVPSTEGTPVTETNVPIKKKVLPNANIIPKGESMISPTNEHNFEAATFNNVFSNAVSPSKEAYAAKFIATQPYSPDKKTVDSKNINTIKESLSDQYAVGTPHYAAPTWNTMENKNHNTMKTQSNIISSQATTNTSTNSKKFIKPRSFSHSVSRPKVVNTQTSNVTAFNNVFGTPTTEDENIGFIPKIIVRSRRSSLAMPQLQQASNVINQHTNSNLLSPSSSYLNITHALNTTLVTSKSRKNSFSNFSRRSSFNVSSTSTSRKSSIVAAPNSNSIAVQLNHHNIGLTTLKQRNDSIYRKEFQMVAKGNQYPTTQNYIDSPVSSSSTPGTNINYSNLNNNNENSRFYWNKDEDNLLIECSERNLTSKELSILFVNKSETEIQDRLDALRNDRGHEIENIDPLQMNQNSQSEIEHKKTIQNHEQLPTINNILNN